MISETSSVVKVADLSRRFGGMLSLDCVNLEVPRGVIFGLVGENGAGKTTLIRHLLGLWKAQTGTVRVFGRDPAREPVDGPGAGRLCERGSRPARLDAARRATAVSEGVLPKLGRQLRRRSAPAIRSRSARPYQTLSQGQRARVGLLAAPAYRPEILILDEPSTGLDPIVRREILAAIIRTIAEEGRTVLFSSHLLEEVERVSDHVALLDHGRIVLSEPLEMDLEASSREK